jgi:phage protein D
VVDNPRYASPGRITLAGTALGISTNLRRQKKTREWKNVTLKGLAERIAAEQGVTISYHGPETAPISKVTQKDESDIQLLLRQCSRTGYALKIDRNRLVIYNRKEMDAAPAAFTIERVGGGVTEYEFSEEKLETYRRAIVRYKHPDKGLLRAVYEPANAAESGYDLIVREHCGSQAEAMELGRARLEAANRGRLTCSMGHRGDVRMVSGVAVKLHGFGRYDGRYMIDEARHSVQGGYSTGLTMVRVT